MRVRRGSDGVHLFERNRGLNILLDEVSVPEHLWSRAPRFVSFALTNSCDLHCPFCYAPKARGMLDAGDVVEWCRELDLHGCLGVGFGGGEPTLFPGYVPLCRSIAERTDLSVGFTTHSHRITQSMGDELRGNVNFIRVSMDGIGSTYESIRKRSFPKLLDQIRLVSTISQFGINFVVNDGTISDLDDALKVAEDLGAEEFLVLPEISRRGISPDGQKRLADWLSQTHRRVNVSISELGVTEGIPLADPFTRERGVNAYVHINAFGKACQTSYDQSDAVDIDDAGLLAAINTYKESSR